MFQNFYGNNTIQNVTVALLSMFNQIYVQTVTSAGEVINNYRVPIDSAPKSKLYQIRKENYSSESEPNQKYYVQLPRMVLSIPSLSYDPERAYATNEIRHFYIDALNVQDVDGFITDIQPVPYNFNYTLSMRTNLIEEWTQIIEQILPAFNPSAYLRIKEFPNLNIERDLQVNISPNIAPNFEESQTETTKRTISCDIQLTVNGWLYGIRGTEKLIKYIDSRYLINDVVSEQFVTSAVTDLSAAPSEYSFSALSDDKDTYLFTSAINYEI